MVYVHEDREAAGIFRELSVAANISMSQLSRISRRLFLRLGKERELAERVIRDVQLRPPLVRRPAGQFSGGNQQKILLGRSLAMDSRMLIIDEPKFFRVVLIGQVGLGSGSATTGSLHQ